MLRAVISLLMPREYTATARVVIEPPAGTDSRAAITVSPVYLESLLIAVFGAVLGVTIGLAFGSLFTRTLRSQGLSVLSVPWGQAVVFLILAAVIAGPPPGVIRLPRPAGSQAEW